MPINWLPPQTAAGYNVAVAAFLPKSHTSPLLTLSHRLDLWPFGTSRSWSVRWVPSPLPLLPLLSLPQPTGTWGRWRGVTQLKCMADSVHSQGPTVFQCAYEGCLSSTVLCRLNVSPMATGWMMNRKVRMWQKFCPKQTRFVFKQKSNLFRFSILLSKLNYFEPLRIVSSVHKLDFQTEIVLSMCASFYK